MEEKGFSQYSIPFLFTKNKTSGTYKGKRLLDITISSLFLLLSIPVLLLASLLILISSGKPVMFKQERMIPGGKSFTTLKLRTMKDGKVTWAGKILRPHHIDEIPQFWNVIKGDMSLVGPRPIQAHIVKYFQEENHDSLMLSGITGLMQITLDFPRDHENPITTNQKVALYLLLNKIYKDNCCLANDLIILFFTIFRCLTGKSQ